MKEVYSYYDFARVGYYQSILEEAGIRCFVRNQSTDSIMGSAYGDTIPSLCVVDPAQHRIAKQIIQAHEFPQEEEVKIPPWKCTCGEEVPEGFDSCWSCGADLPRPPEGS